MHFFSGLNLWAVVLAAGASFLFGGIWYGALSEPWMKAAGLSEERIKGSGRPPLMPFLITIIAQLVMAWVLAGILLHMSRAGIAPNVRNGLISAVLMWLGFIATSLVVNHQFQMQKPMLTLIDLGHWLGVLLIQGAILGATALR